MNKMLNVTPGRERERSAAEAGAACCSFSVQPISSFPWGGGGKQFRVLETLIKKFSSFFDFKNFSCGAFAPAKAAHKRGTKHSLAFTLAEVLITLAIIGVVAAMTIPGVLAHHKKTEATSKLKKFYAMLQNASLLAQTDGLNWEDWAQDNKTDFSSMEEFLEERLLPYINYRKTETEQSTDNILVYLNDGTDFELYSGGCIDFEFDINGLDNGKNAKGVDRFIFLYCPMDKTDWIKQGQIIPYQPSTMTTRAQALAQCKASSEYCTALLFFDNWEFKKDYPHKI